jgi:putative ABC transport system permease protein
VATPDSPHPSPLPKGEGTFSSPLSEREGTAVVTLPEKEGTREQIVEYEICGIVSIHGWLWMNKISGVRKRGYRSGAMLLAPYEAVKNDYRLNDAAYFWFDRTPGVSDAELEQSLQHLADRLTPQGGEVNRPMVKVSSRAYLQERVGDRADQVIQAAAKMPLILLVISSFGMMGTIAASIRSRRFEFGVLRSLGVTRFGLIRLILAEALLIALVVIIISVGFGVIAGWCFIGIMKYVAGFGSFTSPLTIPVYYLSLGIIVALIFCFLAALGPAVAAGRTSPTRLLQER